MSLIRQKLKLSQGKILGLVEKTKGLLKRRIKNCLKYFLKKG